MKKYEGTLSYMGRGLGKISSSSRFMGGGPGPRERLGFFLNPRDIFSIFSKGHFSNVTSSMGVGRGFAKYQLGGGREQRHETCQRGEEGKWRNMKGL